MLVLFLFLAIIIAFATSSLWTVQIAAYGDERFYIRRFMPMMGWEYLQLPEANRFSEGGFTAPYWWTGRNYNSVSVFKSVEAAEDGFKLYKEYKRPKVKTVKRLS